MKNKHKLFLLEKPNYQNKFQNLFYFILEMNNLNLKQYIETQFIENPFLSFEQNFYNTEINSNEPDISFFENFENHINIQICQNTIPQLTIDNELIKKMQKNLSIYNTIYMNNHLENIELLKQAINYREKILKQIAKEIIFRNQAFFFKKNSAINFINKTTISDSLLISEKIINLAIKNKSIQTAENIFMLQNFFFL